jgi:hypothetical protein
MMPYKSDKQRRYMHAKHPEIAARWDKETGGKVKPAKKAAAKKAASSFKDRAKAMAKDKVAQKKAIARKAYKKK